MNGLALIDEAIRLYSPIAIYGMFSGGHDSLPAVHIASKHPKFSGVVHINTGTGVIEDWGSTIEFVRDTAKEQGWPLTEINAKEDCGQDYERIVVEEGFPGPAAHLYMYTRLKERGIDKLVRDAKVGHPRTANVLLVTGARSQESDRRMGHVEPIFKAGGKVWVAVIHDWTKQDCNRYLADNNIKRSIVVDMIHKSGECLCGAYAKPGERDELAALCPRTFARIQEIERKVAEAGHIGEWGERSAYPKRYQEREEIVAGQEMMPFMPMCSKCVLPPTLEFKVDPPPPQAQ